MKFWLPHYPPPAWSFDLIGSHSLHGVLTRGGWTSFMAAARRKILTLWQIIEILCKLLWFVQIICDAEHYWVPQSGNWHFFCHVCWKSSREKRWLQQIVSAAWEFTTSQASSPWQLDLYFSWSLVWSWTQDLPLSMVKQVWIVQVRTMTTARIRSNVQLISLQQCSRSQSRE